MNASLSQLEALADKLKRRASPFSSATIEPALLTEASLCILVLIAENRRLNLLLDGHLSRILEQGVRIDALEQTAPGTGTADEREPKE